MMKYLSVTTSITIFKLIVCHIFLKIHLGTKLLNNKAVPSKYSIIEIKNHTASFNYIEPIIKSVDLSEYFFH